MVGHPRGEEGEGYELSDNPGQTGEGGLKISILTERP